MNNATKTRDPDHVRRARRPVTPQALAALGEGQVAYVRPIQSDELNARCSRRRPRCSPGLGLFALLSARGTPILLTDTRDAASRTPGSMTCAGQRPLTIAQACRRAASRLRGASTHDPSTAAISRSMSSGRDRRWSPSLISVSRRRRRPADARRAERVAPRHVGVLHALQDVDRAAGHDRRAASSRCCRPSSISARVIG